MGLRKRYKKFLEKFKITLFRVLFILTLRTHAFTKGIFFIKGKVEDKYLDYIKECILTYVLKNPRRKIFILIDSGGGSVEAALNFYDFIKGLNVDTTCIVVGKCFSAALTILAAGKRRLSLKHSKFFFHQMIMEMDIDNLCDKERCFSIKMEEYDKISEFVYELQGKEFAIEREVLVKLRSDGKDYNKKLFADEALSLGVIQEIVDRLPFVI